MTPNLPPPSVDVLLIGFACSHPEAICICGYQEQHLITESATKYGCQEEPRLISKSTSVDSASCDGRIV